MSRIKLFGACVSVFAVVLVAVAAYAASGTGSSNAALLNENGDPFTPAGYNCTVECIQRGLGDWDITNQLAVWNTSVNLGLETGMRGKITITPNGGGSLDVEIVLPSNVRVNGENYQRDQDLVLDGVVSSWPVGTNQYTLRERVNFSNGSKTLHLRKGVKLNLTVQ